jgi:glycosyltransferase involved in cell wall biosynthesis
LFLIELCGVGSTKILQIAERTYPARGGVELHVARISEALVKMGHQVTVVVFNSMNIRDCGYGIAYQKPHLVIRPIKPVLPSEEYRNGVRILRFESKAQLFSYYWSPSMLSWLLENSDKFDVMHTHTYRFSNNEFTALAHVKNKTPFVFTGHDELQLEYMGFLPLVIDKVYSATLGRLLVNMAEKVIAFDKDYAKQYHRYLGVPNYKIRIIPNGVDWAYFNNLPDGHKLKEAIGNPQNVLLYIGRFIDYKNPDLLIASFKIVLKYFPNSRLIMIGADYGLLSQCKKLAASLDLTDKVIFFENANEETKLQALNIADVCLIPSDYESFGLVALEAQAAGVPVIASWAGGLKHIIVEGKTGLFLKEITVREIADKILLLLNSGSIRSSMGSNGKEFARNFSWDTVSDRLLDLYKEIV